jgi:hypothetical protein
LQTSHDLTASTPPRSSPFKKQNLQAAPEREAIHSSAPCAISESPSCLGAGSMVMRDEAKAHAITHKAAVMNNGHIHIA